MSCTSDSLGRIWSHDKLDQILSDPDVERLVQEAEKIGSFGGDYEPLTVSAWARKQGRTRPGIALLHLLCWRSLCRRSGRFER